MAKVDFPLLEDAAALAGFRGWGEEVYRDLQAVRDGRLSRAAFDEKYLVERSILVLDVTGFTVTTLRGGAVHSFLRILDAQRVCFPILREFDARLVRAFADDIVALFDDCSVALDAALEIHRRIETFNAANGPREDPPECCIGIGSGAVYEIGPNLSMGDEMNRASILGEDTARGGETLVTEGVQRSLAHRTDVAFVAQSTDDILFPYYRVEPR